MTRRDIEILGMPYVPGRTRGILRPVSASATDDSIVVLAESDVEKLTGARSGLVVVDGAPFSHAMIRLMGMGVPTVIVSAQQASMLETGREVFLDGATGRISTEGDSLASALATPRSDRVVTADGVRVFLLASVRGHHTAQQARLCGAEAIGLVRSEFLAPTDGQQPDAEFYLGAFADLCRAAAPLAVTVRLLDVAADKLPDWSQSTRQVGGPLGMQGVRLFGDPSMRAIPLAQLEAVRVLSEQFSLRVLLPYLVRYEELAFWTDRCRRYLPNSVPIGAMAETPAAALDLGNWFDNADFVALGCNDLMQCLFAADRGRSELRNYLDPYAPPLYRFLRQVAIASEQHLQELQLCGVLAQLPGVLPILLGLGYRVFSVEATLIPHLQRAIQDTSIADAEELAEQVCDATWSREVREILGIAADVEPPFRVPEVDWPG